MLQSCFSPGLVRDVKEEQKEMCVTGLNRAWRNVLSVQGSHEQDMTVHALETSEDTVFIGQHRREHFRISYYGIITCYL